MNADLNELNLLGLKYFSNDINNLRPAEFKDINETSVTICPTEPDAFILKKHVAGYIKEDKTTKESVKNSAVYRGLIGYVAASKMLEDETSFIYQMSLAINQGLRELNKELGHNNMDNYSFTIFRPGTQRRIFGDTGEMAAVEFRIFAKRKD